MRSGAQHPLHVCRPRYIATKINEGQHDYPGRGSRDYGSRIPAGILRDALSKGQASLESVGEIALRGRSQSTELFSPKGTGQA